MASGAITYELPTEVANITRCYICKGYLSCGPVKIENGNSICGRCEASSTAVVHVTFENIMANFTFPCRYDSLGCKERVLFNTSMAHELKCPNRAVPCPALLHNNCNLNVPILAFHSHVVKFHSDLITKDGTFKINPEEEKHCNLITMVDNVLVVIKYLYDSVVKCLHLEVASALVTEELVYYKIQIVSDLTEGIILNFSEKQCSVYETHTFSTTNAVQIEIEKYLTILSNPSSLAFKIFSITINSKVSSSKNEEVVSSSLVCHLGEAFEEESSSLLADLRENICVSCKKLSFPIYCPKNEPLQKYCKKCGLQHSWKDVKCVWYSNAEYKKNCEYPCIFKGCSYSCVVPDLVKHVEVCESRTYQCPVDACADLFRFNEIHRAVQHLKDHATYCPNPKKITIDLYDGKSETKMYFTNIGNIVILFTSKVSNTDSWSLTSNLPAGVTLNIFFRHDHCRLATKPMTFDDTKQLSLTKSCADLLPCYAEFLCLTAVISIEKKVPSI